MVELRVDEHHGKVTLNPESGDRSGVVLKENVMILWRWRQRSQIRWRFWVEALKVVDLTVFISSAPQIREVLKVAVLNLSEVAHENAQRHRQLSCHG
jgi:hypothetical protein